MKRVEYAICHNCGWVEKRKPNREQTCCHKTMEVKVAEEA